MDGVTPLAPGDVFGDFRIESVAGRGGMGVVYRAVQLDLGRPVALKLIAADRAADPDFRERFQRESRLAARSEAISFSATGRPRSSWTAR